MITIDEITADILPEPSPPSGDGREERSRRGEERLEERVQQLLVRRRHRRRRLSDR